MTSSHPPLGDGFNIGRRRFAHHPAAFQEAKHPRLLLFDILQAFAQHFHLTPHLTHIALQLTHLDLQLAHIALQLTYVDLQLIYVAPQLPHFDLQLTYVDLQLTHITP